MTDPRRDGRNGAKLAVRRRAIVEYLSAAQGARGWAGVVRFLLESRIPSAHTPREPVAIPFKALDGEPMLLRPGTTDLSNASAYLAKAIYLPPPGSGDLRRIVEVGTNIGAGITALAHIYPDADLVGVEPNKGNLEVARANVARFGNRVRLFESAVWSAQARLVIAPGAGQHGLTVRPEEPADPPELDRIPARTIDSLLAEAFPGGEEIDYMHVTIEGSERRVFDAGGNWPRRVRTLRVELHPYFGYSAGDCISQLEALGYRATAAPDPPDKWVFAVREE